MTGKRGDLVRVGGTAVRGVGVDARTRCVHYGSEIDVVAIALPCCERFYPCFRCHDALADHEREPWPDVPAADDAVLCGDCGALLSMETYLAGLEGDPACPDCGAAFNPGCLGHRERYVDE